MPENPKPTSAEQPLYAAGEFQQETISAPIVCLGIGSGGLESVRHFLAATSPQSNLACILYDEVGQIEADLLALETSMPVKTAEDGTELAGNVIYLLPDRARMVVAKGCLVAFVDDGDEFAVPPLDLLLHSLAVSAGSQAIALLFSGCGDDGQRGAVSITRAGGLVLVEDPNKAAVPDRLHAIIDAGLASAKASPEAMPQLITQFLRGGDTECRVEQGVSPDDPALGSVFDLLSERFGLDLHIYKRPIMVRRIRHCASLANAKGLEAYVSALEDDDREVEKLHDDLGIGVINFFRDPDAHAALAAKVVPNLIEHRSSDSPIRIWVPACATGEEAYSIAMLITEHLRAQGLEGNIDIVASDQSSRSLQLAGLGCYARDQLLHLPDDLRDRYMEPMGERFRVVDFIRDQVTFVQQDLVADPPLADMDLVSCRNFLINLTPESLHAAFSNCRRALSSTGFLFTGPNELPRALTDGLAVIDQRWCIYRKMEKKQRSMAIEHLPRAHRKQSTETIQPPLDMTPGSIGLSPEPRLDDDQQSMLDGLMEQNQQMLESTIDTLLASNDVLRRRNRDLREENQRLTAANAALDDMATLVAHDLKAPLLVTDQLVRQLETEQQKTGNQAIHHHQIQLRLQRLRQLIDDLVAYAREDFDSRTGMTPIELDELFREVSEMIGFPKGFKLEIRPRSLSVRARRVPLACVLRNLLADIVEHHGGTRGHIRIAITHSDDALDIRIADDGRGLDGGRDSLGLAIVRQLISAEGGHFDLVARSHQSAGEARLIWPIERARQT